MLLKRLRNTGEIVDKIDVQLSYQIIKHFSAGLYTSPNKAIEELVANSYDALARHVHVIIPDNLAASDAVIWVVDDGESMDIEGFKELWRIGESNKRDPEIESKKRPPIGKFGIGKLATYVLANELTHICKRGRKYFAITMNYALLENDPKIRNMKLELKELSSTEAEKILEPITEGNKISLMLFGRGASSTWTVAAMSSLKDMAKKITTGRLNYVLRTALPINPDFNLYLNNEKLKPSKLNRPIIEEWKIGRNDKIAENLNFETKIKGKSSGIVVIPQLGNIWGKSQLYEDPLPGGKSDILGRSNGYFILVRERLINIHDELFGLEALSHGAFSRFRMVVHADGLDDFLRATRESVSEEEEGVKNFRKYIRAKFNEVRVKYENWLTEKETEESISRKVSRTPRALSKQPLIKAVRLLLEGKLERLRYTAVPPNLSKEDKIDLLKELEKEIEKETFFKEVVFDTIGVDKGLAIFDAVQKCFKINILHPFYQNYYEHYINPEPFQLIAITEVLTETYLIEEELSPDAIYYVLEKRDRFLRELVYSTRLSTPLVAQKIKDCKADSTGLEDAVYEGLRNLGFEVTKMGQSGKPEGVAFARLGVRDEGTGEEKNYSVTYDSKSSKHDRVPAKTVGAATIAQHRRDNKANYSLVVAPGYQGDGDTNSNVVKQAIDNNITLITLDDFIRLILIAST